MSRANNVLRKTYLAVYSHQIHFRYVTEYQMMQFSSNKSFKDDGDRYNGDGIQNSKSCDNH